jgi:hypothetical protein
MKRRSPVTVVMVEGHAIDERVRIKSESRLLERQELSAIRVRRTECRANVPTRYFRANLIFSRRIIRAGRRSR